MPFLTILYNTRKVWERKDLGAVPVNYSWFYNSNNPHVQRPVHVWGLRSAQSAVTVTGFLKYDCIVERMIGLLFVSWVQVFITFLLAHFCTNYSKIISIMLECFYLPPLTPDSARRLTGSVAHGHMSREWMKQDGLTPDEMTLPASSCFLCSFEVRLKSISTTSKMWGCLPGVKEEAK